MIRPALLGLALLTGACANIPANNPPGSAPIAPPAPAAAPAAPVAGGYSPAKASDPAVKAAENRAIGEIYTREPQRSIPEKVTREQQVVAGMNYRFTVKMTGMNSYRVVVYKPLTGEMQIASFEKITGQ